jgi:hypothetical protein
LGNVAMAYVVSGLAELPLFLDTVFTAAMCFTAGLGPGLLTIPFFYLFTFFVNLDIPFQTTLVSCFFALCVIFEVLLICFFRKRSRPQEDAFLKEPSLRSFIGLSTGLLVLAVLDCVVVSVSGGIVDFILSLLHAPRNFNPEDTFKLGLLRNSVPVLMADILSRIPINIVDRFIVIFGGYGISLLFRKWLRFKAD